MGIDTGVARPPQSNGTEPFRVMVVDDSAVVRGIVTKMLEEERVIQVVSSVGNGQMAVNALDRYDVEVVVLDIEMPVMDGLTAIPKLLAVAPQVKIIMASTLTLRGPTCRSAACRRVPPTISRSRPPPARSAGRRTSSAS